MSINKEQLADLIERVLLDLEEFTLGKIKFTEEAKTLLLMTAAHESHLGKYIKQVKGPALGIFQMEPATHEDHWAYITPRAWLYDALCAMNLECDTDASALEYNLKYAIVMARVHYYRKPEALPSSLSKDYIQQLAEYAKKHYNTEEGKATPEEYSSDYLKYFVIGY